MLIEQLTDGASHEILTEPLYPIEQVSDVRRDGLPQYYWRKDDPESPANNYAGQGMTNGYSTYHCARGNYIHSVGTQPAVGMLYDEYGTKIKMTKVGESSTPRLINDFGTVIIDGVYGTNTWLKTLNLVNGGENSFDAGTAVEIDHHYNTDRFGRYQPFWTDSRNKVWVYDWAEGKKLGPIDIRAAAYEVSPNGVWLRVGKSGMNRFYSLPDLTVYVDCPSTTQDHSAWSFDIFGFECFVGKDSTRDMFYFYDPMYALETQAGTTYSMGRVDLFSHKLIEWTNHHVATITNPALKGWTLLSTYSQGNKWADNQLFFVELVPNGRIIRMGHHSTQWWQGTKERSYFCEAFASLDYEGRYIYWGCNDNGNRNLELVRMRIPDDVLQTLGWIETPQPEPDPEPDPQPEWRPVLGRMTENGMEWKLQEDNND